VLRSSADVEDAAQAALERAWRHRARCLQPEAPEGWVARIAQREALREYRRRREAPLEDDAPVAAGGPGEEAVMASVVVEEALRRLTAGERELVHLRYMHDLSSEEIGDRLGVSPGAVRVRLHRLRRTLATVIDED
jgi:RNA polymerase sigma-70 factor (ECF subfamily)